MPPTPTKTIRLTTKNAPLFDHAGLVLRDRQWTTVDLDALGQDGRFAIEKYKDQIVSVHPHDGAAYEALVAWNMRARQSMTTAAAGSSPAPAGKSSKKEQA